MLVLVGHRQTLPQPAALLFVARAKRKDLTPAMSAEEWSLYADLYDKHATGGTAPYGVLATALLRTLGGAPRDARVPRSLRPAAAGRRRHWRAMRHTCACLRPILHRQWSRSRARAAWRRAWPTLQRSAQRLTRRRLTLCSRCLACLCCRQLCVTPRSARPATFWRRAGSSCLALGRLVAISARVDFTVRCSLLLLLADVLYSQQMLMLAAHPHLHRRPTPTCCVRR